LHHLWKRLLRVSLLPPSHQSAAYLRPGMAIGHLARFPSNKDSDEAAGEGNGTLLNARADLKRILNGTRPGVELIVDIQGPSN
jgi:hypothetical protein